MTKKTIKLFPLSKSKDIANKIKVALEKIDKSTEISIGNSTLDIFSDGEMSPHINESIRGQEIYILGSTNQPHDNLIEMFLTIDAAKRGAVKRVHVIVPYFGYSRQDKKEGIRGAVGSRLFSDLLEKSGADSIISVDLHAEQIDGFFSNKCPLTHVRGNSIFVPFLKNNVIEENNWKICSPDQGGVPRASKFSEMLNLEMVMFNKRRDKPNSITYMELVGEVRGKKILIIDDMVDTGGSLSKAVDKLIEAGAIEVSACITHPVLSGDAYDTINKSKLKKLYTSDTIPLKKKSDKIEIVSYSEVMARVLKASKRKTSVDKELK